MFNNDPVPAPFMVWIRYIAVFQRFSEAVIAYHDADDRPGILLGGFLADALHNVPGMLWHGGASNTVHAPARTDAWMLQFPDYIRRLEAPERLAADSERILSAENFPQTLGIPLDLSGLELCPLPARQAPLDTLYHACVTMRLMRNYGARPSRVREAINNARDLRSLLTVGKTEEARVYTPWKDLERIWTEEAQAQADENRNLAETLLPLLKTLVVTERRV